MKKAFTITTSCLVAWVASAQCRLVLNPLTKQLDCGVPSLSSGLPGVLPVANGGTGAATLTGVLKGNGTSAVGVVSGTASDCVLVDGSSGACGAGASNMTQATANDADNAVPVAVGTSGRAFEKTPVTIDPSTGDISTPGTISTSGAFSMSGAEQAKPAAPAAGSRKCHFDSTDHVLGCQDSTGNIIDSTVKVAAARTANQFVTHVDTDGVAQLAAIADADVPSNVTRTIASGVKALATAEIASEACTAAQTDTATGIATTDTITWTPNGDITAVTGYAPVTEGGLSIYPYPTANTVNFKVCNPTSAAITPGAVTLNWRVVR